MSKRRISFWWKRNSRKNWDRVILCATWIYVSNRCIVSEAKHTQLALTGEFQRPSQHVGRRSRPPRRLRWWRGYQHVLLHVRRWDSTSDLKWVVWSTGWVLIHLGLLVQVEQRVIGWVNEYLRTGDFPELSGGERKHSLPKGERETRTQALIGELLGRGPDAVHIQVQLWTWFSKCFHRRDMDWCGWSH